MKITEDIVVLPLEYGNPKNTYRASLYNLERDIIRKVKRNSSNQYLIMEIEDKLRKIDCVDTLKDLLEMEFLNLVNKLIGRSGLLKYYLIKPLKKKEPKEIDLKDIKDIARSRRIDKIIYKNKSQ